MYEIWRFGRQNIKCHFLFLGLHLPEERVMMHSDVCVSLSRFIFVSICVYECPEGIDRGEGIPRGFRYAAVD